MRNVKIHPDLILQLFDPENQELGMELAEHCELCWAFLSNHSMIEQIVTDAGLKGHPLPGDGVTFYLANKFLTTLWEHAARWAHSYLQMAVYRHVPADDKAKAKTYRACTLSQLRAEIICVCDPDDTETLDVARKDPDDGCRELAYGRIGEVSEKEIDSLVAGNDLAALRGLAGNQGMPAAVRVSIHERARQRLREIGENWEEEPDEELAEERDAAPGRTEPESRDDLEWRLEQLSQELDEIGQSVKDVRQSLAGLEQVPERLDHTDDALQAMRSAVEAFAGRRIASFSELVLLAFLIAVVVTLLIRWWR